MKTIPLNERLEYRIYWWALPVGTAVLKTHKAATEGRVDLEFRARSNWHLELFYPVRVRLTSQFDQGTRSPRRFTAYVKRRWRLHESEILWDPDQGVALHKLSEAVEPVKVPVTPQTQDGLSLVYYARTLPFQLGKTIPLTVTADRRNWDLEARIVRAHVIRLGTLGEWPAVEGRVELAYPVPFFHGAQARVWYSADAERVPLLAKIRSRIGPVTVVLARRSYNVTN